jgi:hypothetical protein
VIEITWGEWIVVPLPATQKKEKTAKKRTTWDIQTEPDENIDENGTRTRATFVTRK